MTRQHTNESVLRIALQHADTRKTTIPVGFNYETFSALTIVCLLTAPIVTISRAADSAKPAVGPTKENALQPEKELARATRTNDADAFCRLLELGFRTRDRAGVYQL